MREAPLSLSESLGLKRAEAPTRASRVSLLTLVATRFRFVNSLGFFTLFVWLVPFSLFVSLSINDNALPFGSTQQRPKSTNVFKAIVDTVQGWFSPQAKRAAQYAAPSVHDKYY